MEEERPLPVNRCKGLYAVPKDMRLCTKVTGQLVRELMLIAGIRNTFSEQGLAEYLDNEVVVPFVATGTLPYFPSLRTWNNERWDVLPAVEQEDPLHVWDSFPNRRRGASKFPRNRRHILGSLFSEISSTTNGNGRCAITAMHTSLLTDGPIVRSWLLRQLQAQQRYMRWRLLQVTLYGEEAKDEEFYQSHGFSRARKTRNELEMVWIPEEGE